MARSVPIGNAPKPLSGFALKKPEAKRPAKARKRRPPLRRCGARHWPEVCPDCLEQIARERGPCSQLSELPGETFEDIFRGAA